MTRSIYHVWTNKSLSYLEDDGMTILLKRDIKIFCKGDKMVLLKAEVMVLLNCATCIMFVTRSGHADNMSKSRHTFVTLIVYEINVRLLITLPHPCFYVNIK